MDASKKVKEASEVKKRSVLYSIGNHSLPTMGNEMSTHTGQLNECQRLFMSVQTEHLYIWCGFVSMV